MVTGRPVKRRKVSYTPEHTYFKPSGVPMIFLEEICLTVDSPQGPRMSRTGRMCKKNEHIASHVPQDIKFSKTKTRRCSAKW
jgi:predicted DNA-binding protein (UPF0251 family)